MKRNTQPTKFACFKKLFSRCFKSAVIEHPKDELPDVLFQDSQADFEDESNELSDSTCVDVNVDTESAAAQPTSVTPGTIQVIIPDMFRSFMAVKPVINPNYMLVKAKSETWISQELRGDTKACKIIHKTNFALFAAIAAPQAGESELRTLCDWGNWVFPFDDLFDNGSLKDNPILAQAMVTQLLAGMGSQISETSTDLSKTPLLEIHDEIWSRISQVVSKDVQRRFKSAMKNYCQGVVEHVDHISISKTPSLTEYMIARRRGVGVEPIIALVEYAQKINIPDSIYHHNSLHELRRILIDMILIQNDILSYCKEQSEGVAHNIITVLRAHGMTTQQAFDHTAELIRDGYRDWYLAQARLSQWTTEIDAEVQRYIAALQAIMLASLHWHFSSDRYFGNKKEEVRKHRTITVLNDEHGKSHED